MKNNFSTPGFLWPLLTLISVVIILAGLNAASKRAGSETGRRQKILFSATLVISLWIGLLTVLSYKGFFADFSKLPPRPVLAMLIPFPFILLIAFSHKGTKLLQSVPPQWLVLMQSFRILVELLLWFAFMADKLPVQMTFEGRNFDVITGILALPVGYILLKKKTYASKLAIVFNITGILLLLNILVIAVLSMPTSFRYFMNEPTNTLVARFPFILLPGVLVPIAYTLHIFSLRQLLVKKQSQQESATRQGKLSAAHS